MPHDKEDLKKVSYREGDLKIVPSMKVIYDLIITAMETTGLVFVACGLGLFMSWVAGMAGFLVMTGCVLLIAAGLSARQQRVNSPTLPQLPSTLPPGWPPTRNANGDTGDKPESKMSRIRHIIMEKT